MSLNISNIRTMLLNAKHKISIDENNLVFNTENHTKQEVNLLGKINIERHATDNTTRLILNDPQIPLGGGLHSSYISGGKQASIIESYNGTHYQLAIRSGLDMPVSNKGLKINLDSEYSTPIIWRPHDPSPLGLYLKRNANLQFIKLGHTSLNNQNGITYYEYLGNASDTEWGRDNLEYLNLGADIITINGDTSKTSTGYTGAGDTPQRYADILFNSSTHELTIGNGLRTLKPTGNVNMTSLSSSGFICNCLNGDYAPSGIVAYFSPQGCLLNGPLTTYDTTYRHVRHTSTLQLKDGEVVIQARRSNLDNEHSPTTLWMRDEAYGDKTILLRVYTGDDAGTPKHNYLSVDNFNIELKCDRRSYYRYSYGSYDLDVSGVCVRLNQYGIALNGEVYLHHISDSLGINTGSIGPLTATQEESDYISDNTLQSIILDLKRSRQSRWDNLIPSEYYAKHSETKDGITMTLNDDGSLTFTGTATRDTGFYIISYLPKEVWQNKYYSGNFQNATATTKYLYIEAYDSDKESTVWIHYTTNTPQLLTPSPNDVDLDMWASFKSGTTVNETIHPMLSSEQYTNWAPICLNLNERLYAIEQQLLSINNSLT